VPNVTNTTIASAETAITNAGFVVGSQTCVPSPTIPVGYVVSTSPPIGTTQPVGSTINLNVVCSDTLGVLPRFLDDEGIGGGFVGGQLNLVEFTYMPERTPFLEGATNLIINRYKQEPTDVRQRGVDYTYFLIPGETLTNVVLTGINAQGVPQANTNPVVTPLVITDIIIDPVTKAKFGYTVSGGQDGIEYTIQFETSTTIQTSTIEEIFSINVLIEDSFP
jgi:hypothetical protein